MNELFPIENLSSTDVVRIYTQYFQEFLANHTPGKPLPLDVKLILSQFKYKKRPCQECPYGPDIQSCSYTKNKCYTTEIIMKFAKSRSLLP